MDRPRRQPAASRSAAHPGGGGELEAPGGDGRRRAGAALPLGRRPARRLHQAPRGPAPARRRDLVPGRPAGRGRGPPRRPRCARPRRRSGSPPDDVEIVGALPPTGTFVTNYAIYPFVGLIEAGQTWSRSRSRSMWSLEFALADLVARLRAQAPDPPRRADQDATYTVDGEHHLGRDRADRRDLLERLRRSSEPYCHGPLL